eukprot:2282592-Pleurochrysis_carterae.AAC.1
MMVTVRTFDPVGVAFLGESRHIRGHASPEIYLGADMMGGAHWIQTLYRSQDCRQKRQELE